MSAPGQSPLDPMRQGDAPYAGPLVPDRGSVPNWAKWAGLILLALGAGLVDVTTDHGKVNWLDLAKHEFFSVGVTLAGGRTKFE